MKKPKINEKLIIESFSDTFNRIKRIDEESVNPAMVDDTNSAGAGVDVSDLQDGQTYIYRGKYTTGPNAGVELTGELVYKHMEDRVPRFYTFLPKAFSDGQYRSSFMATPENVKKHVFNK